MSTKPGSRSSGSRTAKSSGAKPSGSKSSGSKSKSSETTVLQLYCALYVPQFGNYYHWAFAINDETAQTWRVFEVVQDENDNFRPNSLRGNPLRSDRCLQPLTWLGAIYANWLDVLESRIRDIRVPGEALSWNCQDYVMEIWDIVGEHEMVDRQTYEHGRQNMMPYYGQDYGGQEEELEEMEELEEADAPRVLSEEFIYDSDS